MEETTENNQETQTPVDTPVDAPVDTPVDTAADMEMDFESALEDYLPIADFGDLGEGSIVRGEIVRVADDHVLVDVNFKSEGQIAIDEFKDSEGEVTVAAGDKVDVFVVRKNESEGTITLSRDKAKRMKLFDKLEEIQESDSTIQGKIIRRIKGGYTVDLGGVEAFLPGSHVDLRPVPDMDALVSQEFDFRVLKINRRRSNVIVSRRVLLEEEREKKRGELLQTLEEGQVDDFMFVNSKTTPPVGTKVEIRIVSSEPSPISD